MRRVIAFAMDGVLFFPIVALVITLVSVLTNRDLVNEYLMLLGGALAFTVFEHSYGGYTPGKFVCRIRLVTVGGEVPSLFRLFIRSSTLFLTSPVLALFATFLYDWILKRSLGFNVYYAITAAVYVGVCIVFLVLSRGYQTLHDFFGQTVLISSSEKKPLKLLSEQSVAITLVTSFAVITAAVFMLQENGKARKALVENETYEAVESSLHGMQSLLFKTEELEEGIEDFFNYYAGIHEIGTSHGLSEIINPHDFVNEPLLRQYTPDVDLREAIIGVTLDGLLHTRFQETAAKNACRAIHKRGGERICLIQFIYTNSVLHVVRISVEHRLLVIDVTPALPGTRRQFVTLSPSYQNKILVFVGWGSTVSPFRR